jgi:hypothetical protein
VMSRDLETSARLPSRWGCGIPRLRLWLRSEC